MVTFKGFWCITAKKCYIYSAVSYLEKKSAEFKEKVMHSEEVLMNSNIKKKVLVRNGGMIALCI